MRVEFDPAKDRRNRTKHGVSLERAIEFDLEQSLVEVDDRHAYGESRWTAYGELDGRLYVLVFTLRAQVTRVISLRKANEREQVYVTEQRGRLEDGT